MDIVGLFVAPTLHNGLWSLGKSSELRSQRMWILALALRPWVWHFPPGLSIFICKMDDGNIPNFSEMLCRWQSKCCCSNHHTIPKSMKACKSPLGDFQFQFTHSKMDCFEMSAHSGQWVIWEVPCYLTYAFSLWSFIYSRCQLCPLSSSFLPTAAGPIKPGPVPGPRWHRSVTGLWVHRTQAQPVTILAKLQQVNPLQKIVPIGRQIILK